MKNFSLIIFIFIFPVILICTTWSVRQDGNGDFETIQEAIDDSTVTDADFLTVYYYFGDVPYGPIDLGDKHLTINAFSNSDPVIIASSNDPAVDMGSADSSTLNGFTITGTSSQTGILISGIDQINITNCIIEDLSTGISITNSQYIDIDDCDITENATGCAIDDSYPYSSRVSMSSTDLYDNTRAIYLNGLYDIDLVSCLFEGNDEGIRMTNLSNSTYLTNCTIASNEDAFIWGTDANIDINSSIIYENDINFTNTPNALVIDYSCIEDGYTGSGTGNIDDDPLFCKITGYEYHLMEGSPCIDTGDPNTSGADVCIDMGRYETTTDVKECEGNSWNWVSYPRLYRSDNDSVDVTILLEEFHDWDFNLKMFYNEPYSFYPTLEYVELDEEWDPENYYVASSRGYKLNPQDTGDHYLPTVSNASRLDAEWELTYTMEEDDYCWLGYWLPYTQNIEDAFGEFFDDLVSVSAEDWYYEYDKEETPSSMTENKDMIYGKGYVVYFETDIDSFYWTDDTGRGSRTPGYTRPEPECFTYDDLPDYEAIDVIDIPSNVIEIGVFEDDVCVGAVVVQNEDEQILAYTSLYNRSLLSFEVVTNNRGENLTVRDYRVLNKDTGKYENRSLISRQQKSSVIRFGELIEQQNNVPIIDQIALHGNYPNPFNPITNIYFSLPEEQKVELVIYNLKGQVVRKLAKDHFLAGSHTVTWNGKDENGKSVGSGLFLYKLITKDKVISKKMLLLK